MRTPPRKRSPRKRLSVRIAHPPPCLISVGRLDIRTVDDSVRLRDQAPCSAGGIGRRAVLKRRCPFADVRVRDPRRVQGNGQEMSWFAAAGSRRTRPAAFAVAHSATRFPNHRAVVVEREHARFSPWRERVRLPSAVLCERGGTADAPGLGPGVLDWTWRCESSRSY